MTEARVRQTLREFIVTSFLPGEPPESLLDSTRLVTSGVISSLALLELVTFIEDRFGIVLEPQDLGVAHMDSIDLLVALLMQYDGRLSDPSAQRG
jgi:acyl carrier protein